MTKSFGRMLLGFALLSCTSSSGGGGGGLGDNSATNMTAAQARCSVAWNRCKGMALANLGYPGATSEADCVMKIRADDMKQPQGDLPCPVGQMLDQTVANNCLNQINTAACTDLQKVVDACKNLCVAKASGTGGTQGGGFGGTQGGGFGGTQGGGFGGTQGGGFGGSPGQGGSSGGNQCSSCAQSACGGQFQACMANPECVALVQCIGNCSNDACVQNCGAQHQSGVAGYNAIVNCIDSACSAQCGGNMPPMGMGGSGPPPGQGGSGGGDPCDACLSQSCGPQVSACSSPSTPCGMVLTCAQNCMGNQSCVSNCAASNPTGVQAVQALVQCEQMYCAAQCQ